MRPPDPQKLRLSKLRWYFGVVGLLGSLALVMILTDSHERLHWRVLAGAGLPITLAYLGAAAAFVPALQKPKQLFMLLGIALFWIFGFAALIVASANFGLLIPIGLFLAIPAINAGMQLQDATRSAASGR